MTEPLFKPERCEHGKIVQWEVTNATWDDPCPEVEHCELCNPGAMDLLDDR